MKIVHSNGHFSWDGLVLISHPKTSFVSSNIFQNSSLSYKTVNEVISSLLSYAFLINYPYTISLQTNLKLSLNFTARSIFLEKNVSFSKTAALQELFWKAEIKAQSLFTFVHRPCSVALHWSCSLQRFSLGF